MAFRKLVRKLTKQEPAVAFLDVSSEPTVGNLPPAPGDAAGGLPPAPKPVTSSKTPTFASSVDDARDVTDYQSPASPDKTQLTPSNFRKRSSLFGKKKQTPSLISPRLSNIKQSVYEPPNLQLALRRMRYLQPHEKKPASEIGADKKTTKKLPLTIPVDEMMNRFSDGIVFWFVVLRDYLYAFLLLTVLSGGLFHAARVANSENGTDWDQLSGLARATFGAGTALGLSQSQALFTTPL